MRTAGGRSTDGAAQAIDCNAATSFATCRGREQHLRRHSLAAARHFTRRPHRLYSVLPRARVLVHTRLGCAIRRGKREGQGRGFTRGIYRRARPRGCLAGERGDAVGGGPAGDIRRPRACVVDGSPWRGRGAARWPRAHAASVSYFAGAVAVVFTSDVAHAPVGPPPTPLSISTGSFMMPAFCMPKWRRQKTQRTAYAIAKRQPSLNAR